MAAAVPAAAAVACVAFAAASFVLPARCSALARASFEASAASSISFCNVSMSACSTSAPAYSDESTLVLKVSRPVCNDVEAAVADVAASSAAFAAVSMLSGLPMVLPTSRAFVAEMVAASAAMFALEMAARAEPERAPTLAALANLGITWRAWPQSEPGSPGSAFLPSTATSFCRSRVPDPRGASSRGAASSAETKGRMGTIATSYVGGREQEH
mmetsp:Transcript_62596/g.179556  ORF Transcript_62596/g.179556 Transcript_62596/m.179556 type:complete len:214 (-) Transcript_62596:90-731(-)